MADISFQMVFRSFQIPFDISSESVSVTLTRLPSFDDIHGFNKDTQGSAPTIATSRMKFFESFWRECYRITRMDGYLILLVRDSNILKDEKTGFFQYVPYHAEVFHSLGSAFPMWHPYPSISSGPRNPEGFEAYIRYPGCTALILQKRDVGPTSFTFPCPDFDVPYISGSLYDWAKTGTFPKGIVSDLLSVCTFPKDLIFDPFAQSAEIGLEAIALGRSFKGYETNSEYKLAVDSAFNRTIGDPSISFESRVLAAIG